jgi:hypothetical protein
LACLTTPAIARAGSAANLDLLRLCAEYHRARDQRDAIDLALLPNYPVDSAEDLEQEEEINTVVMRVNAAMDGVSRIAARARAGVQAKAAIVARELPGAALEILPLPTRVRRSSSSCR